MTSKKLQANSGTLQIGGTVSFDNAPSISGSGFVTLTDAQTVDGAKTFTSGIVAGTGSLTSGNRLRVIGSTTSDVFQVDGGTDGTDTLKYYLDGSGNNQFIMSDNAAATKILLSTGGNSYLTGGNVGIGTSDWTGVATNADNLLIGGSGETGITLRSTTASSIRFNDTADAGILEYNHSSNYMRMIVNGATEAMRIDSTGAVTLGPSSGLTTTHVIRNAWNGGTGGVLQLNNTNTSASPQLSFASDGTDRWSLLSNNTGTTFSFYSNLGTVTAGTISSAGAWTLGPNGAVDAVIKHKSNGRFIPNGDNTYNLGDSTNRWAAVYAATGSIITTSDSRLKQNIRPLEPTLAKVLQLSPSKWDSKYETYNVGNQGFIADDVQAIFPELVSISNESIEGLEDVKQLDVGGAKMASILVKAIQELNAELQAAKAEIELLKNPA